jgi:hypothetical protein
LKLRRRQMGREERSKAQQATTKPAQPETIGSGKEQAEK